MKVQILFSSEKTLFLRYGNHDPHAKFSIYQHKGINLFLAIVDLCESWRKFVLS